MQNSIILVLSILIIGLLYTVIKWPGGLHMTFSQHAAKNRQSQIFYASLFLVTLPLLMWFFVSWLVPQKTLPIEFLWFASIAIIFQIICTWVPEIGGRKTAIHRILTSISGIAMLPLVFILATSKNLSTPSNVIAGIGLVIMLVLLGIALTHQKGYKWALLLQVGYYAAFFIAILAATYL